MDFIDKLGSAFGFWFKWSLLFGVIFVVSLIGYGIFDTSKYAIDLMAQGREFIYFIVMAIPIIIGLGWGFWSLGYVPARFFKWGYPYMISSCPSCDLEYADEKCPKCGKNKFLGTQCFSCGFTFEGETMKCEECGMEGLKVKAGNSFEFEETTE